MALIVALLLAACGEESSPGERALSDAADALENVRSGSLRFRVAAATTEQPDREVGFELEGSFRLAEEEGALPQVELALTDLLGGRTRSARFESDGRRATLTQEGRTAEVPDDAVEHLRGRADPADGLLRLHVDRWARAPRLKGDRVVADVDVVNALNDVLGVAADVGAEPRPVDRIEGEDAERLRRAVRSSRLEVDVDDETDVPRRVRMEITFGVRAEHDLARLLGRLAGVRLTVDIELDEVGLRRDR
ncbi:MAG TPA: hypothetical protein VHF47_11215 [Acidimicrobiales bacterium]|nr:hypothetical protein [Acidimicrobiales bacterium]